MFIKTVRQVIIEYDMELPQVISVLKRREKNLNRFFNSKNKENNSPDGSHSSRFFSLSTITKENTTIFI